MRGRTGLENKGCKTDTGKQEQETHDDNRQTERVREKLRLKHTEAN